MRYMSVAAGIEAATVAWHGLGWTPAAFAEIAAFPRAVLAHHYPTVPLHGDFTTIEGSEYGAIDLLVGGTPCQDFSVAGDRAGLGGENGNLTLEFSGLARRCGTRWLAWENVPGAFSLNDGRDFGAVIASFAGYPQGAIFPPPAEGWGNAGVVPAADAHGYGLAWRVLDAQFAGVPQRRRRIFVVGYIGDWRRAAAVLLERESLLGNSPPRRQPGALAAAGALRSSDGGCDIDHAQAGHVIAHAFKASHFTRGKDGAPSEVVPPLSHDADKGDQDTLVLAFGGNNTTGAIDVATACNAHGIRQDFETETFVVEPVAFTQNSRSEIRKIGGDGGIVGALAVGVGVQQQNYLAVKSSAPPHAARVRRLTPREWERLQGFPDDYTLVQYRGKPATDGPRYAALGNSMAVPVMRWIGERIAMVEGLT